MKYLKYSVLQDAEKAYDLGYEVGLFFQEYGAYIGATLVVLVVLIIMYVKKHRQKTRDL